VKNITRRSLPGSKDEQQIVAILNNEPKMFDEIVNESAMHAANVSSLLTILEMKGFVRNLGMGQWIVVDY